MEENNMSVIIIDKLTKLNEIEIKKTKVLTAIFIKLTKDIMNRKIQSLISNLEGQAKYYGQNVEDYTDVFNKIVSRYREQLSQVIEKYNSLFINMQLELQEAECNQKIAITNLKKSFDIKKEIDNKAKSEIVEDYKRKINACLQKKINYDIIIEECEKELNNCSKNMEKLINNFFGDKSCQISLKEEKIFKKIINKIMNNFVGASRFNTFVLEPINIELEIMEGKLPNIIENIKDETVDFVAKIRQAKEETNSIFENMINQDKTV